MDLVDDISLVMRSLIEIHIRFFDCVLDKIHCFGGTAPSYSHTRNGVKSILESCRFYYNFSLTRQESSHFKSFMDKALADGRMTKEPR